MTHQFIPAGVSWSFETLEQWNRLVEQVGEIREALAQEMASLDLEVARAAEREFDHLEGTIVPFLIKRFAERKESFEIQEETARRRAKIQQLNNLKGMSHE